MTDEGATFTRSDRTPMSPPRGTDPDAGRAVSPALGFAIVLVFVVIVAVTVGMFVADVSGDLEPDATFNWSTEGEDESVTVTLEHTAGEEISGDDLRLDASGYDSTNGSATFADWGAVSNGSAYTIGYVDGAVVENGSVVNTTDEWNASDAGYFDDRNASIYDPDGSYEADDTIETTDGELTVAEYCEFLDERLADRGVYVGDGVLAFAPEGLALTDGATVLVHEPGTDANPDALQELQLVWDPAVISADLDSYRVGE